MNKIKTNTAAANELVNKIMDMAQEGHNFDIHIEPLDGDTNEFPLAEVTFWGKGEKYVMSWDYAKDKILEFKKTSDDDDEDCGEEEYFANCANISTTMITTMTQKNENN